MPPPRTGAVPRTVTLCTLALGVAVLTAGCGGFHVSLGGYSATPSSKPTGHATGLPSTVPSDLPSGLPSGIPTKVPTSLPASPSSTAGSGKLTAKDGTNVKACKDGRCEILVHKTPRPVPVAAKFGAPHLTVTKIGAGGATFVTHSADGAMSRISTGVGGTVGFKFKAALVIEVVDVRGHTAKIRLHPR